MECRVFVYNTAAEFHRISQIMPQNLAKFAAEKWEHCLGVQFDGIVWDYIEV